jgi:hypothetical protein
LNGIESNLTFVLEHVFNSTSNQCYLNLADFTCSLCAPNNLYFSIAGPTFTLCSSWCDQIWESCKPYSSIFQIPTTINSTQFCKLLFSELDEEILKINDTACFGGYPIKDIECTGCIPGTTPCGGAGW